MSDSVELIKCVGRGNQGYAKRDVVNKRYWTILKKCTCDDDPYGDACPFCLCERGHSGFYSDAEVIAFLKPTTRTTDPLLDEMAEALEKAVHAINDLIANSIGVAGLHLNGDVAHWEDLRTGGRLETWLSDFDAANEALQKYREQKGSKCKQKTK